MLTILLTFSLLASMGQALVLDDPGSLMFKEGEILEYRLRYGWFTVGKAEVTVDPDDQQFEGQSCYKVDIAGRTAGLVGIFTHVEDSWGAYVNKKTMLPVHAYSDIEEGKYTRNERIYFNQETGDIVVEMTKKGRKRPTKYYDYGPQIHDLISGYMYLRNTDFRFLNKNDTVRLRAFYDEIYYDMKVLYKGTEMLDTQVGELDAHKVVPIVPENDIFPGTQPITIWVSADDNQLPLKIEADMFFGTAHTELVGYKNLRYGPDFN